MAFCMLLMLSGSVYRLGRCLLGYHGVRRQVQGGESRESTRRGPRACSWLYRDPRVCGRLLLLLNVIYLSLITLYSFFGRFQQRRFIFCYFNFDFHTRPSRPLQGSTMLVKKLSNPLICLMLTSVKPLKMNRQGKAVMLIQKVQSLGNQKEQQIN